MKPQVFLWAGSAPATTPLHFDTSHNCYAQLLGEKTFWLLPPAAIPHVHVHPLAHPSDRQSQVPWIPGWLLPPAAPRPQALLAGEMHLHDEVLARFPDAWWARPVAADDGDGLKPLRAALSPGDVLLLPALWLHQVRADTASVSVNVWTLAQGHERLARLLATPLPLYSAAWSADQLLVYMQYLLTAVLEAILPTPAPGACGPAVSCAHAFVTTLVLQKYAPLGLLDAPPFPCSASRARGLSDALRPHVTAAAATFADMSAAERFVYLGAWVETQAQFAVGPIDTGPFLHACIPQRALDAR